MSVLCVSRTSMDALSAALIEKEELQSISIDSTMRCCFCCLCISPYGSRVSAFQRPTVF